MDPARKALLLKVAGLAALAFASATAFAAYLRPDMVVNFANMVLCY